MDSTTNKSFNIVAGKLIPRLISATSQNKEDGIVWYVDIEHDHVVLDLNKKQHFDEVRYDRALMCSRASGLPCEAIHYHDVSKGNAEKNKVRAMCISGNTTDWAHYDFEEFKPLFDLFQSGRMPTLALCGGHQLIALAYGANCDAIRELEPGEEEVVEWARGYFAEVGYLPITILKPDPIFDGFGKEATFFESHYWEIKELPDAFELLASSQAVVNQVIKLRQSPVYGTQFHPEVNDAEHPDGFRLMQNFFQIAFMKQQSGKCSDEAE